MTAGQQRALQDLWPRYGVAADAPLDLQTVFGRRAPCTLEIGFGNGDSLATMAAQQPDTDFIGIEVHRPGVGRLLQQLAGNDLRITFQLYPKLRDSAWADRYDRLLKQIEKELGKAVQPTP